MIIKLIKTRGTNPRNAFRPYISYVLQEQKIERVYRSDNLMFKHEDTWLEMQLIADQNRYVSKPAIHAVLSWSPLDSPTREEIQICILRLLTELDCNGHQYLAVVHKDAMHLHAHVVANRIGIEGGAAASTSFNGLRSGKLAEDLTKEFGWHAVPSLRNLESIPVFVNGEVYKYGDLLPLRLGKELRKSRPFIARPSFHEWLGGEPRAALFEAIHAPGATWQSAHATLIARGIVLQEDGSVVEATNPRLVARAERLGNFVDLQLLEQRLGQFEARSGVVRLHVSNGYSEYCSRCALPQELLEGFRRQQRPFRAETKRYWSAQRDKEAVRVREVKQALQRDLKEIRRDPEIPLAIVRKLMLEIRRLYADQALEELRITFAQERDNLRAMIRALPKPLSIGAWLHREAKRKNPLALAFNKQQKELRAAALHPPAPVIVLSPQPIEAASIQQMRDAVSAFGGSIPTPSDAARAYMHYLLGERELVPIERQSLPADSKLIPVSTVRVGDAQLVLFEVSAQGRKRGVVLSFKGITKDAVTKAIAQRRTFSWDAVSGVPIASVTSQPRITLDRGLA